MPRPHSHSSGLYRSLRLFALLAFAVGTGMLVHRLRGTPEQSALTDLVERRLPGILATEAELRDKINRLSAAPGLQPQAARALLVDEIMPGIAKLKRRIDDLPRETPETRVLLTQYAAALDQLGAACRTCVHVIDDPKLPQNEGIARVRSEFSAAEAALKAWDAAMTAACVRHRLAPPHLR